MTGVARRMPRYGRGGPSGPPRPLSAPPRSGHSVVGRAAAFCYALAHGHPGEHTDERRGLLTPLPAPRPRPPGAPPRLVRGQPPRPAVAPHHGSLRRPRQRDHAAADAGAARRAALLRLAAGVAGPREPRRGAARRGAAALAGPRLQQPRAATAGVRAGGRRRRAGRPPRRAPSHTRAVCARSRASAPTRRAPSSSSPTTPTWPRWTPTSAASSPTSCGSRRTSARRTCRRSPTPPCRAAAAATGTTRSWTTGRWCSRRGAPASPRSPGRERSRGRAGRSGRACSGDSWTTGRSRWRRSPPPSELPRDEAADVLERLGRDGLVTESDGVWTVA